MRVNGHVRCLQRGFTARVGNPRIRRTSAAQNECGANAVVRGESEKGGCGTVKRCGGRDAHGGGVGVWGGKYTKSAQEDYTQ
jgi:hypothetical protein